MAAQTYTVGDGMAHATHALALAAIITYNGGDLSALGGGVQTIESYELAPSNQYNERVHCTAGFSNASVTNHIDLLSQVSHEGIATTTAGITINGTGSNYVIFAPEYGHVDGYKVTGSVIHSVLTGIIYGSVGSIILNNIVHDVSVSSNGPVVGILAYNKNNIEIYNNLIYSLTNTLAGKGAYGIYCSITSGTKIYYNTIWNLNASVPAGIAKYFITNTEWVNNTVNGPFGFYNWGGGDPSVNDHNASTDNTAALYGGTNYLINVVQADQFIDLTPGSEDFHLKEDASLRNAGVAIVGIVYDYEGNPRSDPPDIGCAEFTVGIRRHDIAAGIGRGVGLGAR